MPTDLVEGLAIDSVAEDGTIIRKFMSKGGALTGPNNVNNKTLGTYAYCYGDNTGAPFFAISKNGTCAALHGYQSLGNGLIGIRQNTELLAQTTTQTVTWTFNTEFDWILGMLIVTAGAGSVALTQDYTDENSNAVSGQEVPMMAPNGSFNASATLAAPGPYYRINHMTWNKKGGFQRTLHITVTGTITFDIGFNNNDLF